MKLNNKNIFASVSAGYSSVMMAIKLREWYPDHNIVCAMANTSKEHPESLSFMQKASEYYGLDVQWIESVISQEKGVGSKFKVVSYENLKVNGEIFEEGIKKYGIPNVENKWCNREMKIVPLTKYANHIFGKDNYSVAVGLRTDEIDRRKATDYRNNNIFYPLVDNNINYRDRNKFWKEQPIKLGIPAYKGNCDMCFEKSNRKLMTIIKEEPDKMKWWGRMINDYGDKPIYGKPSYNELMEENNGQTFYRDYMKISDLVEMAKHPFTKASDEYIYESDLFDLEGDCGSGCQVF